MMLIPLSPIRRISNTLFNHYYKTPHYPLQIRTHTLEGISPLWSPCLANNKAILFCFTQNSVSEIQFGISGAQRLGFGDSVGQIRLKAFLTACWISHWLDTLRRGFVWRGNLGLRRMGEENTWLLLCALPCNFLSPLCAGHCRNGSSD